MSEKRSLSANDRIDGITIVSSIEQFAKTGSILPQRLLLSPSLTAAAQIPLFREADLPPDVVAEHYNWSDPPPVSAYAIADHVLGSGGLLRSGNVIWLPQDCFPPYFKGLLDQGKFPAGWTGSVDLHRAVEIVVDQPCACPVHPNMVYGHFLLEILPRLYILRVLRDLGVEFRVALPRAMPHWLERLTRLYFDDTVLLFDPKTEIVRAPIFIVPSMMHTGASHIHPLFNVVAKDLMYRAGVFADGGATDGAFDRVYLSRRRTPLYWHQIENEEEVEETLQKLGFAIIHPQELSVAEQLRVYATANCICAEYSSALHNTIFSKRGTRVISLNRINWYQSLVTRVLEQSLAFIPPSDGKMRDWRLQYTGEASIFKMDCNELRETVMRILG